MTAPVAARPWHWRPASRAGVLVGWVLMLAVTWGLALLVGAGVGLAVYLATDHRQMFAGLDALFYGVGAFLCVSYVMLVAGAVLLARRYVPPERRSPGWVGSLVTLLVAGVVVAVVAVARADQLLAVATATVLVLGVPALVVPRVPRSPGERPVG